MGMDFGETFGSDQAASEEGVWISLGGDASIKVARLGNPVAARAYLKIPRALRVQMESTVLANKQSDDFLAKFMGEHILKGWKGMSDGGKDLSFTEAAGIKMLKKHRRFRNRIWNLGDDEDNFNIELTEKDSKNS